MPVMLELPAVVGIVAEHDRPEKPAEAAGADAVVFGASVEVFGCSPGNCTALCGLIDGEALMPGAPVAIPPAEPAEEAANGAGAFAVGTFNGSVKSGNAVPLKLVPPEAAPAMAVEPAATAAALSGVDVNCPDCGLVWAFAAPKAPSHRIIARTKMRCIASSFPPDVDEGVSATMRAI
jgi:hypothetical protein